jgi:hypothetical protein
MNLLELTTHCQARTGYSDPNYADTWKRFINEAIREFARRQPWAGLEDVITLKTDGTKYLILPHYVDTIISLLNITDENAVNASADWDREATSSYAQGTTGGVTDYTKAGEVPALKNPTGYVWFKSGDPSDTALVHLSGLVAISGASGALETSYKELSIAAAGSTPVTLTSLFTKFFSIGKATNTTGDYVFFDAGNSNAHISLIPAPEYQASFKRLELFMVPDAQKTFWLRFRHKIPALSSNHQAPHPAVRPDYIVQQAISLHLAEQEQYAKSAAAEARAVNVLQAEANKDTNFDEPASQIVPFIPFSPDEDDDYYRGTL